MNPTFSWKINIIFQCWMKFNFGRNRIFRLRVLTSKRHFTQVHPKCHPAVLLFFELAHLDDEKVRKNTRMSEAIPISGFLLIHFGSSMSFFIPLLSKASLRKRRLNKIPYFTVLGQIISCLLYTSPSPRDS